MVYKHNDNAFMLILYRIEYTRSHAPLARAARRTISCSLLVFLDRRLSSCPKHYRDADQFWSLRDKYKNETLSMHARYYWLLLGPMQQRMALEDRTFTGYGFAECSLSVEFLHALKQLSREGWEMDEDLKKRLHEWGVGMKLCGRSVIIYSLSKKKC